ncbi:hypothetical protein Tco_0942684 [Tanacetum coccineum]
MELVLMAKAFKLNYSTPTNNNQRISSNPHSRQIAQPGMNLGQDRQMQMVRGIQNVGNHNGLIVVPGIANQNLLRVGTTFDIFQNILFPYSLNTAYCLSWIRCIGSCFLRGLQYTELLEPIPKPHQVQQNDSNVTFAVSSVEQNRGTVEQHPATVEETHALYDSLYNNLATKVEIVNSINRNLKETNVELTTRLARYKNQEKCFEINQEKYDKLERCYQKSVYQEQCLTKKINALHLSSAKTITTLNE